MDIDKVVSILQSLDSRSSLAFVIRIRKACSALYDDVAKTSIMTDTTNQVNGRNHRALLDLRIHLRKSQHVWSITTAPRPDQVCHTLATLLAFYIERMIFQEFLTLDNQLVQKSGCIAA